MELFRYYSLGYLINIQKYNHLLLYICISLNLYYRHEFFLESSLQVVSIFTQIMTRGDILE